VVYDQLTDFKTRLGIDYYVTGLSFDQETIRRFLGELLDKTKKGLAFYVKGVRLFWNDIVFCLRLFNRAAQGYTLKPREVRTLRYVPPSLPIIVGKGIPKYEREGD
jgi:LETM1-like protein